MPDVLFSVISGASRRRSQPPQLLPFRRLFAHATKQVHHHPHPIRTSKPKKKLSISKAIISAAHIRSTFLRLDRPSAVLDNNSFIRSLLLLQPSKPSSSKKPHSLSSSPSPLSVPLNNILPSRLCCHTVIHGLLRVGFPIKASEFTELLIRRGIRIRTATLEAIVKSLCPNPDPPPLSPSLPTTTPHQKDRPPHLPLLPPVNSTSNKPEEEEGSTTTGETKKREAETEAALALLSVCREWRHERTQDMFDRVFQACIIQGQIISASLLFALAVTDWEIRKRNLARVSALVAEQGLDHHNFGPSLSPSSQPPPSSSSSHPPPPTPPLMVRGMSFHNIQKFGLDDEKFRLPYPHQQLMLKIIDFVDLNHFDGPDSTYTSYIQALANLGQLLMDRSIPIHNIATLIKALYSIPSEPLVEVSIVDRQGMEYHNIEAYPFFHEIIHHLILNLPTSYQPSGGLPPLSRSTYNTLLHYALRHRLSPDLGEVILEHMIHKRQPPHRPDITTHNILITSANLLRSERLLVAALTVLPDRKKQNPDHPVARLRDTITPTTSQTSDFIPLKPAPRPPSPTTTATGKTKRKWPPPRPVIPDIYSLVGYITHLTVTGRPHVVAQLLYGLIPGLDLNQLDPQRHLRRLAIRRLVLFGPHFIVAVLNALRKAGKTGLTERVWRLAKLAEGACKQMAVGQKFEWMGKMGKGEGKGKEGYGCEPWDLPIHAYTIMIQCYADQARRGFSRYHRRRPSPAPAVRDEEHGSVVKGWAQFNDVKWIGNKTHGKPTLAISRLLAFHHYNSLKRSAYSIIQSILSTPSLHLHQQQPQRQRQRRATALKSNPQFEMDARFFNAILRIFGRRLGMRRRSASRKSKSTWNAKIRFAVGYFGKTGREFKRDPMLLQLGMDMAERGFRLPLAFRRLLADQPPYLFVRTRRFKGNGNGRRPFGFKPHEPAHQPFSLLTPKHRGLPVRRKPRSARGLPPFSSL